MNAQLQAMSLVKMVRSRKWTADFKSGVEQITSLVVEHQRAECVWTFDENTCSWDTDCDNKFQFMNGTPEENKAKYCQYCGGRIKPIRF